MDTKTLQILGWLQNKKVGIFVDDSNVYHAYKKIGWRINFAKFKLFFESHCRLQCIHYHIATPQMSDSVTMRGTMRFVENIKPFVTLKKKYIKYILIGSRLVKKADVDVELALDVVRNVDQLDIVAVMSGDSDYVALREYVIKDKRKSIIFFAFEKNMAWELRQGWHLYLDHLKSEVGMSF